MTGATAAYTYTGATAVNGGTLKMGSNNNLWNTAPAVTFANANGSATIDLNGTTQTFASLTVGGASGGANTAGTLATSGGTLNLNGALTFTATGNPTATQQITGGTLNLGAATRTFTINDSTGAANDFQISSSIIGAAAVGITKAGAGALTLTGANTFPGALTLQAGTTVLANTNTMSSILINLGTNTTVVVTNAGGAGSGNFNAATGATTPIIQLHIDGPGSNGTIAMANGFNSNSAVNPTFDVNNNGSGNTGNVIQLNGALATNTIGTGTISVTGGNGYSLQITNGLTMTAGGAGAAIFNPTTANMSIGALTGGAALAYTFDLDGTSTGNFVTGAITTGTATSIALTKSNTSTWTLAGNSTYSGGTNVQNGTLVLAVAANTLPTANNAGVVLGTSSTSGLLQFGNTTVGAVTQTLNQTNATSVLSANSTTLGSNSVVGGAPNGGSVSGNSVLTLNISTGFTDLYQGSIGGAGLYQNNINLVKSGGGILELNQNLSAWTTTSGVTPTLTVAGGVLQLDATATINTAVFNTGGIINDQGYTAGPNFSLTITGGLITINTATDTFASAGTTASSHGVVALNFPKNTAVADYNGSNMYLGAIGARIYAGSSLTPTSSAIGYQFGGGGNWGALGTTVVGGGGGYLQVATANVVTGNFNVTIGDNGSYNSGAGLFGSASTVEFTAPQNFTGNLILAGGSFAFSNVNQFGSAASVVFNGGNLLFDKGTTTDVSASLSLAGSYAYNIDTNGNNVIFATALANTGGTATGGLSKIGAGTLTLAATTANTYTGATTIYSGTLKLDMNAAGINNIVSTSSPLQLFGGTLAINGHGSTTQNSQSFNGATIGGNAFTVISPSFSATSSGSGDLTIGLGALSRTAGATAQITFGTNATAANSPITASNLTASTLITDANSVPYLTIGTTDWAAGNAGATAIVGGSTVAGFYTTLASGGSGTFTAAENADYSNAAGNFTITAGSGAVSLGSFRFSNGAVAHSLVLGTTAGDVLQAGGFLINSSANTTAPIVSGGHLTSLAVGGDITFIVDNGAYVNGNTGNYVNVSSIIQDNGAGHTGVTITSSTGSLYYASVATSTYSGVTTVAGNALLDLSAGATIQPNANSPIGNNNGAASNFVINGGVIYTNGNAITINPAPFTR